MAIPVLPIAIFMTLVALIVAAHFGWRLSTVLDAVRRRIDGDPDWAKDLGPGAIEDLGR